MSVNLAPELWPRIEDLFESTTLADLEITADFSAMRDRRLTRQIASTLHDRGHAGLGWRSAFWGEWHTIVLFRDRFPADTITFGAPRRLDIGMASVVEAARLLDIG